MAKAKGRTRVKGTKGKRWKKGHSSSSNPETTKHRVAAKGRGKLGSHLAQVHSTGPSLTAEALSSHDAEHSDDILLDRDGDAELLEDEESGSATEPSAASSSVYSLIESAHPVFGRVKRLWNSPLESHREVCAVLAAISEVIKVHEGKDTETEYFAALMTALETAEGEKALTAIAYLLSIVTPKVPAEVLQSRYSAVCKIITDRIAEHEMSDSTALLKSLMSCLISLLGVQDASVWAEGYTQRVFQMLLNFSIHPKPRLRKSVQGCILSMLREGTATGEFHPSAGPIAKHCKHVIEKEGVETSTLHVLGLLKDCLANFPTQQIKTLCETVLKLMTLGNSVVRTTSLRALHGLFSSLAGPQGLTSQLNGQLISALYDYQPSLVDAQLLQAWITVMQSAHTRLTRLDPDLAVLHLPHFFATCISCLLSEKRAVTEAAATAIQVLLKECVGPLVEAGDEREERGEGGEGTLGEGEGKKGDGKREQLLTHVQKAFKAVEVGLKYKYYSSWNLVLRALGAFYHVAGKQCKGFMAKSLVSLCELRATVGFPYCAELEEAFGAAMRTMGVRTVLTAAPLQLEVDSEPLDFPRSWMLPAMRDHIRQSELGYFTTALLPLAGSLRAKAQKYRESGKPLEAKLYDTLQLQIWSLLPGFCTEPVDLKSSFHSIARILGSALSERPDLRITVCQALRLLIETNKDDESKAELARYSKNYLPILFNLYTSPSPSETAEPREGPISDPPPHQEPLLEALRAYLSITEQQLLEGFFTKVMSKLRQEELSPSARPLIFDLAHSFVPHLSQPSLTHLLTFITPLLDSANAKKQKRAYSILTCMLSCNSPAHQVFQHKHLNKLRKVLLESLSTARASSKKPRLKCLLHIVNHLTPDNADFIAAIVPEVILCVKEVNEKSRALALKLLLSIGYAAQRCFRKSADESVTDYFLLVLAGLAGSPRMVAATIMALARLVYEFHDLLGSELVQRLLSSVSVFLSSKRREVVRAALGFVKITIGVLSTKELAPHVEDLVSTILGWGENTRNHFRLKARVILERLIRKFSYELVAGLVPEQHRKLLVHIRKMNDREKRKRLARTEGEEGEEGSSKRRHKPSYEDLLYDSSDEEEKSPRQPRRTPRGRTAATDGGQAMKRKSQRGTWIKEGGEEEPVNFLDPNIVKRVVATDPSQRKQKRGVSHSFETNPEGKLVITEEEGKEERKETTVTLLGTEDMEVDTSEDKRISRKRRLQEEVKGGGSGIHRQEPSKMDFDYGTEYRAKKAKGDIKKPGKPDPFAYVPLMRQKLNRRKQAKLTGQFSGLMKKAKKGSATGAKKLHRRKS